jgi:hypothetical protein
MSKKNKQEWISFTEDGQRWMICKHCQSEYVLVDENTAAITCSSCVIKKTLALKPMDEFFGKQRVSTGRPAGWHFMNEFVDKDGNVFHKGKEQPELKGTLPPTKVKPPKKRKKLTADQKLFKRAERYKKKLKAKRKHK